MAVQEALAGPRALSSSNFLALSSAKALIAFSSAIFLAFFLFHFSYNSLALSSAKAIIAFSFAIFLAFFLFYSSYISPTLFSAKGSSSPLASCASTV